MPDCVLVPLKEVAQYRAMRRGCLVACALAGLLAPGCARPYAGPKTLAALGTGLLVVGGAAWIAGEGAERRELALPGMVVTGIGAAAVVGAGVWLARSAACQADADCPAGEECREVPAPPGGIPYRQCMRR